ncbi:MAG: ABC transporter permease [Clostridium sp.]|uniref:ABC transporter permease n=1 Tax=Clostridium sp. TaxID=1506 RepID=UPI003030D9C5
MYSKIAIGNVKKSFKDYTIYFLTLTLAVCIFYSFNSIESQKALLDMKSSGKEYATMLTDVISYVSVFVSVILGCLILYANNFLIKKRNKELGIYMTLGMGKNKISRILILETLIVGVMSLVSGLILGIIASQGLSAFVSKLFSVGMAEYTFVISTKAIGKTIIYFGIIFILVMIFNTFIISKYKIIDLLTAGRKNEDIKFKNPIIYLIAFILCVVSLGFAYSLILKIGLDVQDIRFLISILLGITGTFLFFFSLTGFVLYIIKRNKKVYFKGLNIFVVKQINSKVNTNFVSMAIICLMLFITICVLSTGISFKNAIEAGLKDSTPFDVSATMYVNEGDEVTSVEESLRKIDFKFDNNERYAVYNEYDSDIRIQDIIGEDSKVKPGKFLATFIKISDYNKIKELNNEEKINLKKDEVLVLSNFQDIVLPTNEFLKGNDKMKINGKEYLVKNKKVIEENLESDVAKNNIFTVVMDDNLFQGAKVSASKMNVQFSEADREATEKAYREIFKRFKDGNVNYEESGFINGYTKEQIFEESKGMTTTILFVGMYLGIVFLITSMAVLALQQLSEASDSIERYKSLKKIGANEKSINKTIFTQTLVYFSIPVILAFVHSIVGIEVANDFISAFNKPDIRGSSIITAFIFITIYIGYFYATYTGYKNIVKSNI